MCATYAVIAFARKTGDYPSLSHVDIKLMALTYQLECEVGPGGGANLRKEPQRTVSAMYMEVLHVHVHALYQKYIFSKCGNEETHTT